MQNFNKILKNAAEQGASDIHLSLVDGVSLRINGRLVRQEDISCTASDMEELLSLFMTGEMALRLKNEGELSLVYDAGESERFRINLYRKNKALAASIRIIPKEAPMLSQLQAPQALSALIKESSGIILEAGKTGSGRSTTVAAMIREINLIGERHLVSIEENIEFPIKSDRAVIDQRKLVDDTKSYSEGIKAAIRENADIIVLSELDCRETVEEALYAAETGKLIIGVVGATDSITAIKRLLSFYEPERQDALRGRLSDSLICCLSQLLIPTKKDGRKAAFELLIADRAVRNLLKEGKYGQVNAIMQADHRLGMMIMDDSICEMYLTGQISRENALFYALDRTYVEERLNGI